MSFFPLRIHSGFSYLRSGLTPERAASLGKKLSYDRLGISDITSLSGYAPFYHACSSLGIKPFFGADISVEMGTLSLYVKNEEGYRNLCRITFEASKNKPLPISFLKGKKAGLIAIMPLEESSFKDNPSLFEDEKMALSLNSLLEDFSDSYLGVPYCIDDALFLSSCRRFIRSHSYKGIAFPLVSYRSKEDAITIAISEAISNHATLELDEKVGHDYFLSNEEATSFYTQQEIAYLDEFASQIDFDLLKKRGSFFF